MIKIDKKTMLLAKITCPKSQNIIKRKRLLNLLDESYKKPVTWVAAPGGSGKTTLIASYINSRNFRSIWYQVDEGDFDLASFFYYMWLAVKKVSPKKKHMPFLTPDYLNGLPTFTRRYFEELYRRLSLPRSSSLANAPIKGVLVFDNYQKISANSKFNKIIADGLEVIPKGVKVIFIDRTEPPPHLIRFKANNKMSLIGWDEIRFTLKETKDLISVASRQSDNATIEALYEKTDGWAAGVVLLSRAPDTIGTDRKRLDGMEDVFSYFASEIFQRTDKLLQEFLLKTVFLPQITAAMAEKITGIKDAQAILSELCRNNFFTVLHHGDGESYYQYHPLFREFLTLKAKSIFSSAKLLSIQHSAAILVKQSGKIEDAALLFMEAGDWGNLSLLILDSAKSLIGKGRNMTLEGWLRKLPKKIFGSNPMLQYWMGVCRMPFNTDESRRYFELSFDEFIRQKEIPSALLSWSGAVETIFLERGDFTRMDKWFCAIKELLEDPASIPAGDIDLAVVTGMVEIILTRTPFAPGVEVWLKRAMELMGENIPPEKKLAIADPLHLYFIYTGDHISASELINILRNTVDISKATPLAQIRWHLIESVQAHMVDASFDECLSRVMMGLEISGKTGVHLLDIPLYQTGAYASLIERDLKGSEKFLKKMQPMIRPSSFFDIGNCSSIRLSHDLLKRRYVSALKNAVQTIRMAFKTGSPIPVFLTRLGMAQALIGMGRYKAASAQIRNADKIIKGAKRSECISWLYFMKAYLHIKKGDLKYTGYLKKALKISARQRYLNTLHWSSEMMSLICACALEHGIETDYVKLLIRRRNLPPPVSISAAESWPYPVKIYTLGRFRLLKDDNPVVFLGRVKQKPLDLLKAIITFGGVDVPSIKLMVTLWPDAEGDKASQSLKFTLHALRKLLGGDIYIHLKGGKLEINTDYCMVDIWQLQCLFEKIDLSPADDASIAPLFSRAMNLYRGDFLSGDEMLAWTTSLRERIKNSMLNMAGRLSDYYENSADYGRTIETCNKTLEIDCLREDFYRRLMLSYLNLGRESDAILTYRRCRDILLAELGVAPSAETEKLFSKISKKK